MLSWLQRLFGEATHPIIGSLSSVDLGAVVGLMLAALALNALAAWYIRRKTRHMSSADGATSLRLRALAALGKPIYVLIWICGIYVASLALLMKLASGTTLHTLQAALDTSLQLAVFAVLFWCIYRLTRVLDQVLASWAARTGSMVDSLIAGLLGRSLRVVVPVLGVILALPILNLPAQYDAVLTKGTTILFIVAVAVMLFQAVSVSERAVYARYDIAAADNLRARKIYTQVHVIGKTMHIVVGVFAVASILMLFDAVRHIGTSLLASAGVLGIVAGIAAQKPLGNLFAGVQIALTQPMRQDDVVIVEGEWGRIEEITLSYVVVHIWDDRRLVVPLTYFIEKPFQNWTRTSAGLLGSVFVWVDYSFPVEEGRKFLEQVIEASPLWDRRFWNLAVTDATERTMQLRILATAADSSKSWDLRCDIREKFIAFIQRTYPQSLPVVRLDTSAHPAGADAGAKTP
ncbi:MAG TPA: mechanosensitive ion channel domain-containing protein [Steroidobacteraceae bacterium]|nr:mechanosensitive ion channel domain-containing protein [Steroidobacteraceae bacterium]